MSASETPEPVWPDYLERLLGVDDEPPAQPAAAQSGETDRDNDPSSQEASAPDQEAPSSDRFSPP